MVCQEGDQLSESSVRISLMTKTILVTGVAGFIGFHSSKKLLEEGWQVIGIDNLNDYYDPRYKQERLKILEEFEGFVFYKTDILDQEKLRKIFSEHQPQVVLHLAALVGVRPSIINPLPYTQVNVLGTQHVFESVKEFAVSRVVYASSSSVYGDRSEIPFRENDSTDPISPYAATKRAAELLAHTYHHLHQTEMIGLRFFTVYGPHGRPDMAPYLFTEAILENKPIEMFGDGSSARDYTHIDDVVSGVVASLTAPDLKHEIINLGNSEPIKLKDFIRELEEVTGKQAKIKRLPNQPGDVRQTFADISKAKKLLNYQPKTNLSEGLKKFVDWYKAHRQ